MNATSRTFKHRTSAVTSAILLSLLACSGVYADAPQYSLVDLGAPPGAYARPTALNDSGVAVGVTRAKESFSYSVGALWSNGIISILPGLNEFGSSVSDINATGTAVGVAYDQIGTGQAIQWRGSGPIVLNSTGRSSSAASAINNHGVIAGQSTLLDDQMRINATIWDRGQIIDLGRPFGTDYSWATAINDSGIVAGNISQAGDLGWFGVTWTNGNARNLGAPLGGLQSGAFSINSRGDVVGYATNNLGRPHGVIWQGETAIDLGTLGGTDSVAQSINDSGVVVGYGSVDCCSQHAFVWYGGVMLDLNTLVGTQASGWILQTAVDINSSGEILAYGSPRVRILVASIDPRTGGGEEG